MPNIDAVDVGDGVRLAGRPIEGNAQGTRAVGFDFEPDVGFFLPSLHDA